MSKTCKECGQELPPITDNFKKSSVYVNKCKECEHRDIHYNKDPCRYCKHLPANKE